MSEFLFDELFNQEDGDLFDLDDGNLFNLSEETENPMAQTDRTITLGSITVTNDIATFDGTNQNIKGGAISYGNKKVHRMTTDRKPISVITLATRIDTRFKYGGA